MPSGIVLAARDPSPPTVSSPPPSQTPAAAAFSWADLRLTAGETDLETALSVSAKNTGEKGRVKVLLPLLGMVMGVPGSPPPGLFFRSPPLPPAAITAPKDPMPGMPLPMDEDAVTGVVVVAVVGTGWWDEKPIADVNEAAAVVPPDLVTNRVFRKFPRLLKLRLTCACVRDVAKQQSKNGKREWVRKNRRRA